jgi:hypothetical protein
MSMFMRRAAAPACLGLALLFAGTLGAAAQNAALQITVRNGRFHPAEITAPVNTRIVITVKNEDARPMEFESSSLKVEKVVVARGQSAVRIRPLAPGRYEFFDDFNPANRGTLVIP